MAELATEFVTMDFDSAINNIRYSINSIHLVTMMCTITLF